MSRSEELVTATVVGFIVGLLVGLGIVSAQSEVWKRQAIGAGVGQYNAKSGEFEWRANCPPTLSEKESK